MVFSCLNVLKEDICPVLFHHDIYFGNTPLIQKVLYDVVKFTLKLPFDPAPGHIVPNFKLAGWD